MGFTPDISAATRKKKDAEAKPVSAEKPSWWDEDAQGEWTDDLAQGYGAFQSVLGREISATSEEVAGIRNWANFLKDNGYAATQARLALSEEARVRGVDPVAHGNVAVDPATLSEKDREWHSAWEEANPGDTFYEGMLEELRARQGLYSVDVYRGMNDGTITVDGGVTTVTPEAIEKYGEDNLLFWHGGQGQSVRVPEGSNLWIQEQQEFAYEKPDDWEQEEWDAWLGQQNSDGYTLVNTRPERKQGVWDRVDSGLDKLGVGRDIRNVVGVVASPWTGGSSAAPFLDENLGIDEAYFITDPLGITSGISHGNVGMQRNAEGGADLFNADVEDVQRVQGIGQAVVQTALNFVPGVGTALSIGFGALRNANSAMAGQQSWGDAFISTGISAASSALFISDGGLANSFINAANSGVSGALQTGLTGERDWDAALEQGAVSAVASAATSAFGAYVKPKTDWGRAFSNAAVGAGSGYLSGAAVGMEDDDLESATIRGGAQGMVSGFMSTSDPNAVGGMAGLRNWAGDWDVGAPNMVSGQGGWDVMTPWETRGEDFKFDRQFLSNGDKYMDIAPGSNAWQPKFEPRAPLSVQPENSSVNPRPLVYR